MKRHNIQSLAFAAMSVLAVASCNDLKDSISVKDDSNDIEISISEDSPLKKAFAQGDNIGLYLVSGNEQGPKDLSAQRRYNNVKFTMTDGRFISDPVCTFPEDESVTNSIFIYYPYTETSAPQGDKYQSVSVSYDQRTSFEKNDFLYGVIHDYKPQNRMLKMSMKHAFSKINIVLVPGEGFNTAADMGNPTVLVKENYQQAKFDYAQVIPSEDGDYYDMIPNGFFKENDGQLEGVCAILIPQTFPADKSFLDITIDDVLYQYVPQADLTLESGKEYTFTLTINRGFNGVSVNFDALDVTEWDVENIDLDLDELSAPEGDTVTDIDGNEYPIVKIGEQYWIAENLKVTRLNDGTPIIKNEMKLAEWCEYEEPAYAAYNFDEKNAQKYGYLYNKYTVYTDKICPEGWSVPSDNDWGVLGQTLGGTEDQYANWARVGNALKSAEWGAGTNTSGFSALPGGFLMSSSSNPEGTMFSNLGNEANWWTNDSMTGRTISGNSLDRYMFPNVCGLSIRCIYNRRPIK